MKGYEVITSDEETLGEVVDVDQDFLIVEHKHLLNEHRYAVPMELAHADDSEKVVYLSVSRQLVEQSPQVEDGTFDREAIPVYYGLVDAPTDGDPDESAEEMEERLGIEPAAERRARMLRHEESSGPHGRQIIPSDSHEGL
jgi:hypothetical protein